MSGGNYLKRNKENLNEVHRLVEIAENLRRCRREYKKFGTCAPNRNINYWLLKMDEWLEKNYDKSGIDKEMEAILLN